MNVEKQIQYWITSVEEDMAVAEYLIKGNLNVEALFFCHLALECMLKAHVTKFTQQTPPKLHNLLSLAEKGDVKLDESTTNFFALMKKFQLEGRYRMEIVERPPLEITRNYFEVTKQKLQWLKQTL